MIRGVDDDVGVVVAEREIEGLHRTAGALDGRFRGLASFRPALLEQSPGPLRRVGGRNQVLGHDSPPNAVDYTAREARLGITRAPRIESATRPAPSASIATNPSTASRRPMSLSRSTGATTQNSCGEIKPDAQ